MSTLENVDESLVVRHARREAKPMPDGDPQNVRNVRHGPSKIAVCATRPTESALRIRAHGFAEPKLVHRQNRPAFAASPLRARHPSPAFMSEGWMACRAEARSQTEQARLRGFAATARHPSPAFMSEGWM